MSTFLNFGRVGGILLCEERKLHGVAVRRSKRFRPSPSPSLPFFSRLGGPPLLLILVLG
jgi:hypothetical protein